MRTSIPSAITSDIYHYSTTDNTSRPANALHHALAMNKSLRPSQSHWISHLAFHCSGQLFHFTKHSRQTKPESMLRKRRRKRVAVGMEIYQAGNKSDHAIGGPAATGEQLMRQYDILLDHVVPHMHWRMIRYSQRPDLGFQNHRESCSMAVVLVQNEMHSWPKSHFTHDEVGNDLSSGPFIGHQ